ncbi:hypothetical protein EJF36_14540 [Bacillus sp. HMF5848]|uniref:YhcN/YlaJ family sporulation lipoprotein n=1 Tax=Bacillus sp. HMF5848 TaxID=2495421 RepID=UPI000F776316|nr:YhcN/YlaJ family sporulation lipoprotein [Bacillus sp. HMF5848]RSK28000.1 hypothetical protein EJF36_14540 [Bacillus sp. HMF5848]
MNRRLLTGTTALLITSMLVACGANEGAMDQRDNGTENVTPIGFYTNEDTNDYGDRGRNTRTPTNVTYENNRNDANGNATFVDNDGPITEMIEQTDTNRTRYGNGHRYDYINGMSDLEREKTYSNYTPPTSVTNRVDNNKASNMQEGLNYGALVDEITARVLDLDNVNDARTVLYGDTILVAVDLNDDNNAAANRKVRNAVKAIAGDYNVQVVTGDDAFTRVRDLDYSLRNGGRMDHLQVKFRELYDDTGESVQRPFQVNE